MIGSSKSLGTIVKIAMLDMLSESDRILEAQAGDMAKLMEIILHDRNEVVRGISAGSFGTSRSTRASRSFTAAGTCPVWSWACGYSGSSLSRTSGSTPSPLIRATAA